MKKQVRILSVLLCAVLLLGLFPCRASADGTGLSADSPAVCTTLRELKPLLESSTVQYIRLEGSSSETDYLSDMLELNYLVSSGCDKHLEIRGKHTVQLTNLLDQQQVYFLTAYNDLVISGDGELDITIKNNHPTNQMFRFYYYNSAFSAGRGASLTFNGGTYRFSEDIRVAVSCSENSGGVFVRGGSFSGSESFVRFRSSSKETGEACAKVFAMTGGTVSYRTNWVEDFFGDPVRDAFGTLLRGTVLDVSEEHASAFTAASPHVEKVSAGSGRYNIVPKEETFCFIQQPQGGSVSKYFIFRVHWATSEVPDKLELYYADVGMWVEIPDPTLTEFKFSSNKTSGSIHCRLRATYGTQVVESDPFAVVFTDDSPEYSVSLRSEPADTCTFYGADGKTVAEPFENQKMKENTEIGVAAVPKSGWRIVGWRINEQVFPSEVNTRSTIETVIRGSTELVCVLEQITECTTKDYSDVPPESNWAHSGIDFCVGRGFMGSTKSDALTFEPLKTCTRAEIASILYRLVGSPKVMYASRFTDVIPNQWYTDAVLWCAQNGIVSGIRNEGASTYSFKPTDKVTREQMAVLLRGFVKYMGGSVSGAANLSGFADASKVTWSKDAVAWAVNAGLISGKSENGKTYLAPQGNATRQEVAAILMRFCNNYNY